MIDSEMGNQQPTSKGNLVFPGRQFNEQMVMGRIFRNSA